MAARSTARKHTTAERAAAGKADAARPRLRVIDQASVRRAVRRRRFGFGLATLIAAAMFVSALAQAELVRGQQELNELRRQVAESEQERARLERDIVIASAPHAIVERARAMGMVRANDPQYFPAVRSVETP